MPHSATFLSRLPNRLSALLAIILLTKRWDQVPGFSLPPQEVTGAVRTVLMLQEYCSSHGSPWAGMLLSRTRKKKLHLAFLELVFELKMAFPILPCTIFTTPTIKDQKAF